MIVHSASAGALARSYMDQWPQFSFNSIQEGYNIVLVLGPVLWVEYCAPLYRSTAAQVEDQKAGKTAEKSVKVTININQGHLLTAMRVRLWPRLASNLSRKIC